MQALMFFIPLAVLFVALSLTHEQRIGDLVRTTLGLAIGAGLSLFWLLPSVTHFDLPNVPKIYIDKMSLYSLEPGSLFNVAAFHLNPFSASYFSILLILTATIGIALCLKSKKYSLPIGLAMAILTSLILSLGLHLGNWYARVPMLNQFMPLRLLLSALLPAGSAGRYGL